MNTVLSIETPQLTVINGDLITGENTYLSNSTSYVDEIVAPLIQRDLLWASTYGNHDSDFNLSREAIFEREKRYPNSLTQNMVPGRLAGVSNYYLPVFSSDPGKDAPEVILWFFDSRGGNYYQELDNQGNEVSQPDWVDQSVSYLFSSQGILHHLRESTESSSFKKESCLHLHTLRHPPAFPAADRVRSPNGSPTPIYNSPNVTVEPYRLLLSTTFP